MRNEQTTLPLTVAPKSPLWKLLIGAIGIYICWGYYGILYEDIFMYTSPSGSKFAHVWYLQSIEAITNSVFALFAFILVGGPTRGLSKSYFAISGTTQVTAKAFTSIALAYGLSYPVVVLSKAAKMLPVMIWSSALSGATYSVREISEMLMIIAGTAVLYLSEYKTSGGFNEISAKHTGLIFIFFALNFDGVTGGVQKKLLEKGKKEKSKKPTSVDFMFWTNLFMSLVATSVAFVRGELQAGQMFCSENPEIFTMIWRVALCSALGQLFIFYIVAHFDPLVLTSITTTRKVLSVCLSFIIHKRTIKLIGLLGTCLALIGTILHTYSYIQKQKRELSKIVKKTTDPNNPN